MSATPPTILLCRSSLAAINAECQYRTSSHLQPLIHRSPRTAAHHQRTSCLYSRPGKAAATTQQSIVLHKKHTRHFVCSYASIIHQRRPLRHRQLRCRYHCIFSKIHFFIRNRTQLYPLSLNGGTVGLRYRNIRLTALQQCPVRANCQILTVSGSNAQRRIRYPRRGCLDIISARINVCVSPFIHAVVFIVGSFCHTSGCIYLSIQNFVTQILELLVIYFTSAKIYKRA